MIRYGSTQTSYAVVEDNIEVHFSSVGTKAEILSFTIGGAEKFIKDLKDQIFFAQDGRVRIIEKEIADMVLDIAKKQEYMVKKENQLKELRDKMSRVTSLGHVK